MKRDQEAARKLGDELNGVLGFNVIKSREVDIIAKHLREYCKGVVRSADLDCKDSEGNPK